MDKVRLLILETSLREAMKAAGYKSFTIKWEEHGLYIHDKNDVNGIQLKPCFVVQAPRMRTYPTHKDRERRTNVRIPLFTRVPKLCPLTLSYAKEGKAPHLDYAYFEVTS